MAGCFRPEKCKAAKGNTERLCNNIAFLDTPRVDRYQLKENIRIIGFLKITSCLGQHPHSHAAVVAQLSVPSPPKSALAAAFACVEISPSAVVNSRNKPLYSRGQRVKAGEQPSRVFVLDLPVNGHGVFWLRTSLELIDGTAPKAGTLMLTPCWALCHFPGQWVKVCSSSWRRMSLLQRPLLNKKDNFENYSMSLALCSCLHRRCGPCTSVAHMWLHAARISIMGSKYSRKLLSLLLSSHPMSVSFLHCIISFSRVLLCSGLLHFISWQHVGAYT